MSTTWRIFPSCWTFVKLTYLWALRWNSDSYCFHIWEWRHPIWGLKSKVHTTLAGDHCSSNHLARRRAQRRWPQLDPSRTSMKLIFFRFYRCSVTTRSNSDWLSNTWTSRSSPHSRRQRWHSTRRSNWSQYPSPECIHWLLLHSCPKPWSLEDTCLR